jgi:hypothetical protein
LTFVEDGLYDWSVFAIYVRGEQPSSRMVMYLPKVPQNRRRG